MTPGAGCRFHRSRQPPAGRQRPVTAPSTASATSPTSPPSGSTWSRSSPLASSPSSPLPEALARSRAPFATLERLETYEGFFFNYYDTTSLERTSNFVSFVDSAWLSAGLMVVGADVSRAPRGHHALIDAHDYRFFYDGTLGAHVARLLRAPGARSLFHYGVLYAEARLGSLDRDRQGRRPREHLVPHGAHLPGRLPAGAGPAIGRRRKMFAGTPSWAGSTNGVACVSSHPGAAACSRP